MRYEEEMRDITALVDFIPRNYCVMYRNLETGSNNKFAFSPVQHARGMVYRTHPDILRRRLRELPGYKREHPFYVIEGRRMDALFPWPEELLKEGIENELEELFKGAIYKKEGISTMFNATPGEAIPKIGREGSIIYAKVKSKSRERVPHTVVIRNGFLTEDGNIDITALGCTCEENVEAKKKGGKYVINMCDLHPSMTLDEHTQRRLTPDTRKIRMKGSGKWVERMPFNPFTFAENWERRGNMLVPISLDRTMLEWDMVFAYYILDETMAEINYNVFQLINEYSLAVKRAARRDEVTYEFLRHDARRVDDKFRNIAGAEKEALRRFYARLYKFGYESECLTAELGRPAIRLENKSNVITIVPGRKEAGKAYEPPVYTVKPKPKGGMTEEAMCRVYKGDRNPFRQLNRHQTMLDDNRKTDVRTEIRPMTRLWVPEMPGRAPRIELPDSIEKAYGRAIEKYSSDPARDLRIAGLDSH